MLVHEIHFGFYSKLPSQLSVKAAQVSLITDDIDEVDYPIFEIVVFEAYDYSSKLHDIALLRVRLKVQKCTVICSLTPCCRLQTASPITFGENVNFIRYTEAEELVTDKGVIAGWGATFVKRTRLTLIK